MYTPDDITSCFDVKTLKYLQNKNRGGASGQKGTRYEDYFAVYQLAILAKTVLEENRQIYLLSQVLAFVDDLIIDVEPEALQHYQLKNSASVSWTGGKNPIKQDFERQHQLNQHRRARNSQLYLVVADSDLQTTLESTMPVALQQFTQVLHFPYIPNPVKLIRQVPEFRAALVYLSAFDQPDPDKVEFVAKVLMGAWVTEAQYQVSVIELLTSARQVSPCYIRSFEQDQQLDPEVMKILGEIADFSYNFSKGFLHWEYLGGLQQGTPPFSITTEEFQRLQERIKAHSPTTFEALEILL